MRRGPEVGQVTHPCGARLAIVLALEQQDICSCRIRVLCTMLECFAIWYVVQVAFLASRRANSALVN